MEPFEVETLRDDFPSSPLGLVLENGQLESCVVVEGPDAGPVQPASPERGILFLGLPIGFPSLEMGVCHGNKFGDGIFVENMASSVEPNVVGGS